MTGKEEKRNIKTYAALVFVLVFLFALTLMYLVNQEQEQEEKLKATYMAEATVSRVEAQLSQYLTKADVLKNLVEDGHELNDEQFKVLAQVMQDDTHIIEAIELAQDGIITQVYPLAGNEKAVGLDFFADPAREKEANLAMQSGQYTIAGPFELRQGGMGVLLFDPIYTTDEQGEQSFWGFSVMVLNWENFIEDMELQSLENASYHYQIWRRSMSTGAKFPMIPGILRSSRKMAGFPERSSSSVLFLHLYWPHCSPWVTGRAHGADIGKLSMRRSLEWLPERKSRPMKLRPASCSI